MNRRLSIMIALLFAATIVFSQGQGSKSGQGMDPNFLGVIKGKVIDKIDNKPVEYASIAFYRMRDSSLLTGGITNEKGEFMIDKVPMGRYYAEIKFMGYNTLKVNNIAVNPKSAELMLGELLLNPASESLEAVTVTGQRQMLTHNLDKKVFTVDRDINAEGGSALEIIQNIPSLEVDMEGNVSLRGSQNVTILVDGRPSTFSSIEEIPASIIESVEVITNPSARYDPDGLSGIVNIVLKKKRQPGYHGMVMLTAGSGNKYNGTLNFNYRQNKFNFFTNASYRQFEMNGQTITDRFNTTNETPVQVLFQDQDFTRQGLFANFSGGVDYYINNSNTLTLTGGFNARNFDITNLTLTESIADDFYRRNLGENSGSSYNVALNYKLNGKKQGQELTADAFFNGNNGLNDNIMRQWTLVEEQANQLDKTYSKSLGNTFTFQTDLVQPIGNGGRLETGIKSTIRIQDSDYQLSNFNNDEWILNNLRSNNFVYNEQQYSAYAIYSNTFGNGKFSYQGGLRVEQALTTANQKANTDGPIDRTFLNWFPSAHIKWDINSKNSTQVAYSKRVSRPHIFVLNPFVDETDKFNLIMGNPMLNPEFTNSIELSYYYNLPKTRLSATVFNRQTTDIISRFVEPINPGSDTLLHTYKNIDKSNNLGIEGVFTQTITPWWRVNGSASYFNTKLYSTFLDARSSEGYSWSARATSTWSIGKNIEIQLNGNYRSPSISVGSGMMFWQSGGGQGKTAEMYWLDLGARMNVLNKKGTITLRVSDIFNTMKFRSETWGNGFTSNIERTRESRVVFLGFSYKINEYKVRRDKKASDEMDMEME